MKVKIPLVIIFWGLIPANLCHLRENSATSLLDHHQHFSADDQRSNQLDDDDVYNDDESDKISKADKDGLDFNMDFDSILNYFLKSSGANKKRKRSESRINFFLTNLLGLKEKNFERKFAREFTNYAKRGLGTNDDGIYDEDRDFFRSLMSNFEENGNKNKKRFHSMYQKWSPKFGPKIKAWEDAFRTFLKNDKAPTDADFFRNHGKMKH